MRTFNSGLYKIKTTKSTEGKPVYGHIHRDRFLATHKGADGMWHVDDHKPTGCQIIAVVGFNEAKRFIKSVAHLDWDFDSIESAAFFRTTAAVKQICGVR